MKRFVLPLLVAAAVVGSTVAPAAPAMAQARHSTTSGMSDTQVATLLIDGRQVLELAAAGGMSAEQRAEIVSSRLRDAMEMSPRADAKVISANDVRVEQKNGATILMLRDKQLFTVTHADAKAINSPNVRSAANRYASDLRAALRNVDLSKGEALPNDFITVRTGEMTATTGQTRSNDRAAVWMEEKSVASVRVNGREVMTLAEAGNLSAESRAAEVRNRLKQNLMEDGKTFEPVQASDITIERVSNMPVLRLRDANIITVTSADAKLQGMQAQDLAQRWAEDLRAALKDLKVAENETLPNDLVVINVYDPRKGGGAGTGTSGQQNQDRMHQNKDQKHDSHDSKDPMHQNKDQMRDQHQH